jgi:hypothetical protein
VLNWLKTDLSELVHLSKDALHVHLGLLVFLVAMVVFRRTAASLLPWLCVLAVELVNEFLDIFHWRGGVLDFSIAGSLKDIVNTMLWPTLLVLLARFTPLLGKTRR